MATPKLVARDIFKKDMGSRKEWFYLNRELKGIPRRTRRGTSIQLHKRPGQQAVPLDRSMKDTGKMSPNERKLLVDYLICLASVRSILFIK